MMRRFNAIPVIAAMLAFGLVSGAALAQSSQTMAPKHHVLKATNPGARQNDRSDDRFYYDRPVAYRPYPYALPVPFFLGIGFLPRY